jgi:hypothetical protein
MTTPGKKPPIDYDAEFDYDDDAPACELCDGILAPVDTGGNVFVRHDDDCPVLAAIYDKDDS